MAARKESGAAWKRGNERNRSSKSKGRSWNVEAESGDGRTGRVGMVSESKERIREMGSGMAVPLNFGACKVPPAPARL